jgi:hypothetical protein
MKRRSVLILMGLLLVVLAHADAFAQMDFSGEWRVLNYEDRSQRWDPPGTEIGDYLGLPINAADRMRARSFQ